MTNNTEWTVLEHLKVIKSCQRIPVRILEKYEIWKALVRFHGPGKLKQFPGFHDERLSGKLAECRSSRLSLQYRVIYQVDSEKRIVFVRALTPHIYRE